MVIQQKYTLIVQALDGIAGLTTPEVKIIESSDFVQYLLWHLYDSKVLSRAECGFSDDDIKMWEQELENNQQNSQNEDDQQKPKHPMILDLLGKYDSYSREITLYTELIWKVARELNIAYHVLYELVLVHETAHALTHLGKDADGRIWKNFSSAGVFDKEFFAQIYSHLLFQAIEEGGTSQDCSQMLTGENLPWKKPLYETHLFHEALETLGETQPKQYNTWQNYKLESLAKINRMLHDARSS